MEVESGNATLVIHPIVLAEFYWLLKKTGQHYNYRPYVNFIRANAIYRYEILTPADAARLEDYAEIPEMHDRLIAIVAARLGATILTKDPEIQASPQVKCLW
jgi:hypothetical protein